MRSVLRRRRAAVNPGAQRYTESMTLRAPQALQGPQGDKGHGRPRLVLPLLLAAALLPAAARAQPASPEGAPGVDVGQEAARFRSGYRLATADGYVTMAGGAVGLGGLIASAGGYQPTGDILSYGGSGLWALGFCLEAGGLGMQHGAAERLGLDPGRGLFAGGATLGAFGLASTAVSIYVSSTSLFGDKNAIATASFIAGGLALVTGARLFLAFDERRLLRALAGTLQF